MNQHKRKPCPHFNKLPNYKFKQIQEIGEIASFYNISYKLDGKNIKFGVDENGFFMESAHIGPFYKPEFNEYFFNKFKTNSVVMQEFDIIFFILKKDYESYLKLFYFEHTFFADVLHTNFMDWRCDKQFFDFYGRAVNIEYDILHLGLDLTIGIFKVIDKDSNDIFLNSNIYKELNKLNRSNIFVNLKIEKNFYFKIPIDKTKDEVYILLKNYVNDNFGCFLGPYNEGLVFKYNDIMFKVTTTYFDEQLKIQKEKYKNG